MVKYGLIGYPLEHSFSKKFFEEKFRNLNLENHSYELFKMKSLSAFSSLWENHEDLKGLNITIPHKETVAPFLDHQDASSIKVGATNVISKRNGKLIGYNTDYFAFKESLEKWVGDFNGQALILGSGGASKAVRAALADLRISFKQVSRTKGKADFTYHELNSEPEMIKQFQLIINTTPLGTFPKNESYPNLPYAQLTTNHYLYDLVYNPEITSFMKRGIEQGAKTKNGLEMLELQAEKSWDIWNSK